MCFKGFGAMFEGEQFGVRHVAARVGMVFQSGGAATGGVSLRAQRSNLGLGTKPGHPRDRHVAALLAMTGLGAGVLKRALVSLKVQRSNNLA
jgi:hypothetical protein